MQITYIIHRKIPQIVALTWSEEMKKKIHKETLQNIALVSQIGISAITPILLGVFLGQFIDKKLGTNGVFSIIFIIVGAGAGFLNIFKLAGGIGKKRK